MLSFTRQAGACALHHVSTLGVFDLEHDDVQQRDEDTPLELLRAVRGGYAQSKWVAERMLEHAARRGLPVAIHRPGRVLPDARGADPLGGELAGRLVRLCLQLEAVPALDVELDAAPADWVARAIVSLARAHGADGQRWHLAPARPTRLEELRLELERAGLKLSALPLDSWLERAQEAARAGRAELEPLLALMQPELFTRAIGARVDVARTARALEALGLAPPSLSEPARLAQLRGLAREL